MSEYLKSLAPLVAGLVLLLLDKLVAGDEVPDETWIALLGISPLVWAVPNATPAPDRAVVERRVRKPPVRKVQP